MSVNDVDCSRVSNSVAGLLALPFSIALLVAPGRQSVAGVPIRTHSISQWTMVNEHADFSPRDTANGAVFLGKMWLSNGYPDWSSDLWSSSDGVSWVQVLDTTPYDIFSHLTVYDGKLWAISSSVWSSDDGVNWVEILSETPFIYRSDIVVHDGKMWALGNGAEVWWTTDGVTWTPATRNAPYGQRGAPAVAAFGGKLWVMGGLTPAPGKGYSNPAMLGYSDIDMNNDVWSSTDGANWTLITDHAPWIGRMWSAAQSYAGRLWIMGGYDNDDYQNLGDTWYTTDGVNWQQEAQSNISWSPRHYPTTYVFDGSLWIAAGNSWPFQNDVWKLTATPDPLATTTILTASVPAAMYGESVTFTATVAPPEAVGTVIFEDGSMTLGTVEVSSGTATFTTAALPVGTHIVAASYNGNAAFMASGDSMTEEILPLEAAPVITQSFGAASIPLHGTTALTFHISNTNATASLSGVGFTDTLPAGLVVSLQNGLSGSCGDGAVVASASNISLSGGTLTANGSCTFNVDVTGATGGSKHNATDAVTSAEGGTGNAATADVIVVEPPAVAMSFGAASIPLNGTTSLSFTITNPSINEVSLTGVGFSDSLPSGLVVANPVGLTGSCGGGTIIAASGAATLSLSNATLNAHSTCTFSVNVLGNVAGVHNTSTTNVTSVNGGTGNSTNASLEVIGPDLTVAKHHTGDFTQGETGQNFTITVSNVGGTPTSATITVHDTLPSGLTATAISGTGWTCTLGTLTCSRTEPLAEGSSASVITLVVNVADDAASVTNDVTVSGGGEINTTNDIASDPTTVLPKGLIAPTGLTATATSSSQVSIAWIGVPHAMSYQVFRSSAHGLYSVVGTSMTTNFLDSGLTAATTYLYQVKPVGAADNVGPPSNIDLATTIMFTDDPVVAGSTVVRAIHITALRTAINAVRTAAGLPQAFTDAVGPGLFINAIHVDELRSSLDAARSALGLTAVVYTDPTLTANTTMIKAAHIQELRAGVK